ncbi:MAG: DUF1003 domain-containing protein [Ardenticatenales bacterium]
MSWTTRWHLHPGVRTPEQLTVGERAADNVRNIMGSWPFVLLFLGFMGVWMAINSVLHIGAKNGFDPYPYILLNLMLSMVAGLQGAILLIAAKREDQISSELAMHTYRNTQELRALIEQNTELTSAVERLTKEVHVKVCAVSEGEAST